MKCIPHLLLLFQEGVEVRVARIFNTFGPRMHMNDGRVVSNFILQALQGEPLTVGAGLGGWGAERVGSLPASDKGAVPLGLGSYFPEVAPLPWVQPAALGDKEGRRRRGVMEPWWPCLVHGLPPEPRGVSAPTSLPAIPDILLLHGL